MKKLSFETVECNGYKFNIGRGDAYAPVFEIEIDGEFYGALSVRKEGQEIGWKSGIYGTKEQVEAIEAARRLIPNK